ncbi:DUF6788 family protein [Bacillus sp. AFS040349]|uniref:DUF6788 family protein n=1 Tax=Bacillus sp. AFS040349 TaxID=2033502 RepID=UPI000BFE45E5|nr:DUF6788 family protein [Bacillus sp. AFS040349]PGT80519.1 hypothetical protein COD11_21140 [Bacillus sp. AFS040349]
MLPTIKTDIKNLTSKLEELKERYLASDKEIVKISQKVKYVSHGLEERVQGTIVWKFTRCNNPGCIPCREAKGNTHGPYPHIQMSNNKGKVKTKYISFEAFPEIDRQFELTQRIRKLEETLIKKEQEKQQIEQMINDLLYRLDISCGS